MSRYLDPTNDVAFKKLFGTEKHKPLLISFLNAILALTGDHRIKRIEFLPKGLSKNKMKYFDSARQSQIEVAEGSGPNERDHCLKSKASEKDQFGKVAASRNTLDYFLTVPKDQVPVIKGEKTTILDIKCTDERNKQYIVEVQNKKIPSFVKRTQFYVAHSYVSQAPVGSDYIDLKPVILLAVANYELFPNKENVISYHRTLDTETL